MEIYEENALYEQNVGQVLWDLYDNKDDDGDSFSTSFASIDSVIRSGCKSIYDFYDTFYEKGYAKENDRAVWRVFEKWGVSHDLLKPIVKLGVDDKTGQAKAEVWDNVGKIVWKLSVVVNSGKSTEKEIQTTEQYASGHMGLKNEKCPFTLEDGIYKLEARVYDCEGLYNENLGRHGFQTYTVAQMSLEVVGGKIVRYNVY